ncbi:D-aminoacyl-tRNA deacylase [Buchananella hordeovulneris]|uniref:D-aminoacyl-tRNA deacylase n=1 Tax=Buchananella hordeovulneris TaxID=52770 RepID=UPI000F6009FA|nr:D-aminoacyl-tRNA deacylase [Buchananella hordeovulneris]RRD41922.1 D-tyrosyl-tRNA(Tyr) deacylase [Buchananella hordeovulneris]
MRAVLTRVQSASVRVDGQQIAALPGPGLLALVGVHVDDTAADAEYLARKIANLRILADEASAVEVGAPVLVVSQFTLHGATRKGRRPSWGAAAPAPVAQPLVERVCQLLRERGLPVETGRFGAMMEVASVNDGPFTVLLDSRA